MDVQTTLQCLQAACEACKQPDRDDAAVDEVVCLLKQLLQVRSNLYGGLYELQMLTRHHQHDLVGNRLLGARLWDVVHAMAGAFPLLLGANVDAAAARCPASISDRENAWVVLALDSGQLRTLLHKLPTQPQIAAAYRRTAAVRTTAASIVSAIQCLEVRCTLTGVHGHTHHGRVHPRAPTSGDMHQNNWTCRLLNSPCVYAPSWIKCSPQPMHLKTTRTRRRQH